MAARCPRCPASPRVVSVGVVPGVHDGRPRSRALRMSGDAPVGLVPRRVVRHARGVIPDGVHLGSELSTHRGAGVRLEESVLRSSTSWSGMISFRGGTTRRNRPGAFGRARARPYPTAPVRRPSAPGIGSVSAEQQPWRNDAALGHVTTCPTRSGCRSPVPHIDQPVQSRRVACSCSTTAGLRLPCAGSSGEMGRRPGGWPVTSASHSRPARTS